jgi:hypothetical protein
MNSKSELEGGSGNGATIAPLEPGRPDVMPNPPSEDPGASKEGEKPLDDGDEALSEEDMGDVDVNNSVSQESPPQR